MKIEIKKTIKITNEEDWFRAAPPKGGEKQWKKGRSSRLIAQYTTDQTSDFKQLIEMILADCGLKIQNFNCEPEATAGLGIGFGGGGPRNHDLLMIGNNCVIGVEAKVSESFDEEILEVKSKSETRKHRAEKLIGFLVREKSNDKINKLGYQLFTATRGTMCSAEKSRVPYAIFLVIVFTGDVDKEPNYDENCEKNNKDFDAFMKYVNADENGKIEREVNGEMIKCWIKKVEVDVKKVNGNYTFRHKLM